MVASTTTGATPVFRFKKGSFICYVLSKALNWAPMFPMATPVLMLTGKSRPTKYAKVRSFAMYGATVDVDCENTLHGLISTAACAVRKTVYVVADVRTISHSG